MKDVISILQSRIAKRENKITVAEESCCYCPLCRKDGAYAEAREDMNILAKQQKEDKKIIAEIINLRRVVKQKEVVRRRSNPYTLSQLLEGHEPEEMQTEVTRAYYGGR